MIKLKTIRQNERGIKDQFVIEATEPVVIEVINTQKGHTLAHVYKYDDREEPIGAYDNSVDNTDWQSGELEEPYEKKWRLFYDHNNLPVRVGYSTKSDATTLMFEKTYSHYHSFDDESPMLLEVAQTHPDEIKMVIDFVFAIRKEQAEPGWNQSKERA